jgi:DMSO/TMAO reductase YedYZ molybdopterin-dependent catalytic subunit
MKCDKREFIRLIPLAAVAIATGSWWFLGRTTIELPLTSQTTTSTSSAIPPVISTTETFDFPVTWNGDQPTTVNLNDYRLSVDGDVSTPLKLTLADLRAMPSVQKTLQIQCVMGWAADVFWEGIPLFYLLNQAGALLKNIANVTIESVTGYTTTLSSDEAANENNIIALKAGDLPLTVEHGYPARLVIPARPGLKWVKYVTRITCTSK